MAKREPLIHYSGGLEIRNRRGGLKVKLAGWAACCSGEKCEAISFEGRQTRDRAKVTCRACLRLIETADSAPTAEEIAEARAAGKLPLPPR